MNLCVYILLQATQKTLSLTEKSWELAGLPPPPQLSQTISYYKKNRLEDNQGLTLSRNLSKTTTLAR